MPCRAQNGTSTPPVVRITGRFHEMGIRIALVAMKSFLLTCGVFCGGYVTNTTLDTALEAAESYFHVQPVCISTPMLRDMQSGKAENNARSRRQPIRRKLPRIHIADRAFDLSVVTRRGPCQSTRSRSSRYYRLSSVKRALAGETN